MEWRMKKVFCTCLGICVCVCVHVVITKTLFSYKSVLVSLQSGQMSMNDTSIIVNWFSFLAAVSVKFKAKGQHIFCKLFYVFCVSQYKYTYIHIHTHRALVRWICFDVLTDTAFIFNMLLHRNCWSFHGLISLFMTVSSWFATCPKTAY